MVGVSGKNTRDVRYLGRIAPEKMPGIYKSAVALVFPSRYESYPIVPLEAMSSGAPVVVSQSSHVEIIENGREGFVIDSSDPKDYAKALEKAVSRASTMGKNARKTAEKYDWSKQAKLYAKIYDKFCA